MELYLAETLQSVLESDFQDFEVIIMDDGSTDSSLSIAEHFAKKDSRIRVYSQTNGGASLARNNAIKMAQGCYILPVDADDKISSNYVSMAAATLNQNPEVKVVSREAQFFGDKSGPWKFKPFSLFLLCRKNFIDNCSMYRKKDWENVGGYCTEIMGDEDWDFWLSIFETGGGEFIRLPFVGLYYRIRANSRRVQSGHLRKDIIDLLNARHKPLLYKELCGKLHYQRTYSRAINMFIGWFRPHQIYSNTSDSEVEKLVYAANESNVIKKYLRMDEERVQYTEFKEKRFHIPATKIRGSKARSSFNLSNKLHLGYYEEQTTPFELTSYLITRTSKV